MNGGVAEARERMLKRDLYCGGQKLLSYEISYPCFAGPDFCAAVCRINQYCRAQALAFQCYCECTLFRMAAAQYREDAAAGNPAVRFEAVLSYRITLNADCTLSLYFDRYEYTGGERGNTERSSQTWDLQTACRVRLKNLFQAGFLYGTYAMNRIEDQIEERLVNGTGEYFSDYVNRVEEGFRDENFFLTPRGIVLYFQQYDLAPYSEGIPSFLIPCTDRYVTCPRCR